MKKRLLRLIKVLAAPDNEIVGPFILTNMIIDSLELIDGGKDFIINFWNDGIEYQYSSDTMTFTEYEELIKQLEQILSN